MAAGAETKKKQPEDGVTIEDLLAKISEMTVEMDSLREIASNAYGIDVALQRERATAKRVPVQFKEHFARADEPSKIQKGFNRVDRYFGEKGRIYLLREDEAKWLAQQRVIRHVPAANGRTKIEHRDVIEIDPAKFIDITVSTIVREEDATGRIFHRRKDDTIDVKTLRENAEPIG